MIPPLPRQRRGVCVLGLVLAIGTIQAPATASADGAARLHSYRHLAVGNITFLNEARPSLQGGYLFQVSLFRNEEVADEFGAATVLPPRWFAHSLLSMGYSFDTGGGSRGFSGRGQLGVLYKFDGPVTINRVGPIFQGTWGPESYGAGLRTEFFHGNAGLSVGWTSIQPAGSNGFFVGIDLMRCLLQDLGIVSRCGIP